LSHICLVNERAIESIDEPEEILVMDEYIEMTSGEIREIFNASQAIAKLEL
jgi:hypothetical protein